MSAEEMRRRTVGRLEVMRETGLTKLRQVRHQQPTIGKIDGSMISVPGNTAESIGLLHCEIVAELNAIDRSIELVNDVFRQITSPAPEPEQEGETQELYG